MQTFNCPSCGAEITFKSSVSVSCVCPYCRSLVVRNDKDVEAIGKMAELPDDISPFQIGTAGKYKNINFTLIGRMKIGWENGVWNEWFLFSDDGKKGWMAEAQGSLVISFEEEIPAGEPIATYGVNDTVTSLDTVPALGNHLHIHDIWYAINDIKKAQCIGSEGELPFPAAKGRTTTSIDMQSTKGEFAGLEFDNAGKPRLFIGEYVEFDDLHFTSLRGLPGWQIKRPEITPHKPHHNPAEDSF